jgi:hypothetical protein
VICYLCISFFSFFLFFLHEQELDGACFINKEGQ